MPEGVLWRVTTNVPCDMIHLLRMTEAEYEEDRMTSKRMKAEMEEEGRKRDGGAKACIPLERDFPVREERGKHNHHKIKAEERTSRLAWEKTETSA